MLIGFIWFIFHLFFLCPCHTLSQFVRESSQYEYSNRIVPNECILYYNGFYTRNLRYQIINEAFFNRNISEFDILNKNPFFDSLLSDFDVIKVQSSNGCQDLIPNARQIYFKQISHQRMMTRSLKSSKNEDFDAGEPLKTNNRQLFRAIPKQLVDKLEIKYLWNKGITGANINVAIFDTGLEADHPQFKNVIERVDWTDGNDAKDNLGHGTFVCGLVASSKECLGLAPDVNLLIFKVFTDSQVSYTSWFLDAFNYAIQKKVDVLNLSIGGPDFMDRPFIDKVLEITSNNIVMVSGIGNDGPLYGTLNNPADQLDVIGVGGINSEDQIARFSSRGMTTWELPSGYGRVKPDIVTYCTNVKGSRKNGGCRTLSGTSVASPIITGAVALLLSAFKKYEFNYKPNPGIIKQILMAGADRLENANMFEQGSGKLNVLNTYKIMHEYVPQASLVPSYLDLTECPYFWPYCSQPLYHTGMPIIANITILNGMSVTGFIRKRPVWMPSIESNGAFLDLSFAYSEKLWPWSGYLAVSISVSSVASEFEGIIEGLVQLEVESLTGQVSKLSLYLKARIIPTPSRKQRILWDQFHNLCYPSGYFPRDDLKVKNDPLDWNADHPHTNFKEMYQYLRNAGYFIEVLGQSYNCFDARNYGTLLVVDSEEEFHSSEIEKLRRDVISKGLSLIVFADWYNSSVIQNAKFFDENTRKWWVPVTGGANVPALNDLLGSFGILFGSKVYEGEFRIGKHSTTYASGTVIEKFPNKSFLIYQNLKDQGHEFLMEAVKKTYESIREQLVPILGLHQTSDSKSINPGRIAVYGDSNCLDTSHKKTDCFWLLSALLEFTMHKNVYKHFKKPVNDKLQTKHLGSIPRRVDTERFNKYSKFGDKKLSEQAIRCRNIEYENPQPIDHIPFEFYPTKSNFQENMEKFHADIQIEAPITEPPRESNKDENIEEPKDFADSEGEPEFPFLTSLAVLLVLVYIMLKLWRLRKRFQFRGFTNLKKVNRKE